MIRVEHLTKTFGKFAAANDVSFDIHEGDVYAFLGPNGSGKTTTMKCLVGLNIPTNGRIIINGIDIQQYPEQVRQFISYLPQRVVFPENLTAREVMRFYARLRHLPTHAADEALERARFNGFSDKLVSEFSGGMVQRLGLAIAALPNAPILILDEPTANLDPHGVKRFREFILEQKELRKTVLFSTHLLSEVEQLADRAGIFLNGKLVAEESIETLKQTFIANGGNIEDMYLHYVGEQQNDQSSPHA